MRISVTEAKGQLTELVRRAEAGDEIILTRHGQAAVRLVSIKPAVDAKTRRALLDAVRTTAAAKATAAQARRAARTSFTARMAFPDDRHRYVRIDGDHIERT